MSTDLNTSLKPQAFVPQEKAVLPTAVDLASEYASWIGERVSVTRPGYKGSHTFTATLLDVLKGPNNDLILKLQHENAWRDDRGGSVPSIHLIAQSKLLEISRIANTDDGK